MAQPTVIEKLYSPLPEQPGEIVKKFNLEKAVPKEFATAYLSDIVPEGYKIKNEHDLTYKSFILDAYQPKKKIPHIAAKWKTLSSRDRRRLNIHHIPKTGLKYKDFLELHQLWMGYMKECVGYHLPKFKINGTVKDKLVSADYHGCSVQVTQAKCPSYVGVKGIIIQETRETFKIINNDNIVKSIPKKGCIFTFVLGKYELKIYGSNFNYRPMDRVNKKFRPRPTIDL